MKLFLNFPVQLPFDLNLIVLFFSFSLFFSLFFQELPTAQNAFSLAPPQICQRWTQSSHNQNRQRARSTPYQRFQKIQRHPTANIYPQPIITSVKSLSPLKNHKPLTITEVKSLSPFKDQFSNGLFSSHSFQNQSSLAATFSPFKVRNQPSFTQVKSTIPFRKQKVTNSVTVSTTPLLNVKALVHMQSSNSISSSNVEPECIILDEDEENISNACSKGSELESNNPPKRNDSVEVICTLVESATPCEDAGSNDSMMNDVMPTKYSCSKRNVSTSAKPKRRVSIFALSVLVSITNNSLRSIVQCRYLL